MGKRKQLQHNQLMSGNQLCCRRHEEMEVTEEGRRQVEEQVEQLLAGQGSEVSCCDVGLDQSKPATLRKNVTYIVCGVIFNDKVKEEAGFDCEPITLLLIQEQGPQWIRFIFLARVTGGNIKSLSAADQESLQAFWWDRQSVLPLRGRDILRLIDCGLKYHQDPWHPVTLPVDLSCRHVLQRLVLVFTNSDEQIWILLIKAPGLHLPTAAAVKTHAVTWAANMVVQEAMPSAYYDHDVNTLGVFSLQHNGRQHGKTDGVCLNTLVALVPDRVQRNEDGEKVEYTPTGQPPPVENPRYVWLEVRKPTLREKLLEKTKNTSILPLHSLY
ncbi:8-oxo-dGDP phosphatase NUDT18 isoform X2 [Paralichthys olivaceus]|uniref:8-oxo-dGDP phosphatase NUDT18 isoform X2 n=1 Tax=Paralichthys olivaceus TaxID=8255 RepID=UPI00097DFCE9|nr:PREDICTED: 8-oxo-dGDP phosphatase NUDT18 isoform X2 [Paralichthys olivaceus]